MPTFKYEAVNKDGKHINDIIEAASNEEVINRIHSKGCYPIRIKQVKEQRISKGEDGKKQKDKFSFDISIGSVKSKQVNIFTRQLSTLQDAGFPIIQSLNIIEGQLKRGLFKKILGKMVIDIQAGNGLSDTMSKHPKAFDKFYVNVVNAGETAGALDIVLQRLALYREKMQKLKRKIISAMTYPAAVVFITIAIVSGIIMFIIPKFAAMFDEMDVSLPFITLALVNISNFMVSYWYFIFGIPILIFIFYKLSRKIKSIRHAIDRMKFKLPIFGNIINKSVVAKFSRTLATMLSSGVHISDALDNTRDISGNMAMSRAVDLMHNSIRKGESLAKPLREAKICDSIVISMVETGELTGKLDMMLTKVADNYEGEVDDAVEQMASLIEPILIIFLGGAVGTIVIALFMPLIKLMQTL